MPRLTPEHMAAKRATIVAAARGVFARSGFSSTSVHALSRQVGMSVGGIYRHFPSKSELMAAVVAGRDGTGSDLLSYDTAEDFVSQLMGYLEGSDEGRTQGRLTTFIWAEAATDEAVAALARQRHSALRDALAERIDAGGVDAPTGRDRAEVALAALIGLAALQSSGYVVDYRPFRASLSLLLGSPDEDSAEGR